MEATALTYEQQIDTEIAALFREAQAAETKVGWSVDSLMRSAGYEKQHQTRSRFVWVTRPYDGTLGTLDMAIEKINAMLAQVDPTEKYPMNPICRGFETIEDTRKKMADYEERVEALDKIEAEIAERQKAYTGWSRFFLVTSSKGHIHRSMHCSTCRPTTTYGWLPTLSGLTEADAVAEHGPALCSVCYPSAPVEMVGGFISKAEANRKAGQ